MHSTLPVQQEAPSTAPVAPVAPDGQPRRRLAALDGLRLFAALMVVAYHYIAFDSGAWPKSSKTLFPTAYLPASYGWLGVELFFLISGFVICMSCWGKSLGQFALSRLTRLYPAYWFAVVLVSLVVFVWPVVNEAPSWGDAAVNLTMFQDPLGVTPVDGVYWTLWLEMRFYLLFAIVAWRGLTYQRAVAFCVLWAIAAIVAEAVDNSLLSQLLLPDNCWYFIAGIAFYLMHRFRPNLLLWTIVGGCFLIGQHYLLQAHARAEEHMGHQIPSWPTVAILALFFLLVAAVSLGWTRRIDWRWLSTAGVLTYPLYLVHERIGWVVIEHFADHVPYYALLPGLVAAMLGFAWLVHRYVERPLARLLKRGMQRAVAEIRAGQPAGRTTGRAAGG
ncbi:acyltransferase family protein [Streptomyces varsoviensis]|uniref:acyltransferase family protein n=1 Tax=Streptomyces varsoviensis TaxID=67373 RepID=UPI000997353F|nr:acyltransferase [Streptomyces varsoviensis]